MKITQMAAWCCIAYITGCTAEGNPEKHAKQVALPVVQVTCIDTLLHKSYVASIDACQNVEIRARVPGFLEQILVDEGKYVNKGQIMFVLNDAEFKLQLSDAQAALASAWAEVKGAEVQVKRVESLVAKDIVSPSELELAKAKLEAARGKVEQSLAKVKKSQIQLSYTAVRAPFDGIIDRIPHKLGSLITEGTLLTTVSDIHLMHAYFNVSENEYLRLTRNRKGGNGIGQTVSLLLSDNSLYPYPGKIEAIEGEIERATGSLAFRASFPNPDRLLKHGASGKIQITTHIPRAIMIPQKSVLEIQDKNYVFILNKDNSVSMKSFIPDRRMENFILVKSGLSDKDKIVYEGAQNIKDSMKVTPKLLSMDSLLTAASSLQTF